jgi:hypothetical protein
MYITINRCNHGYYKQFLSTVIIKFHPILVNVTESVR